MKQNHHGSSQRYCFFSTSVFFIYVFNIGDFLPLRDLLVLFEKSFKISQLGWSFDFQVINTKQNRHPCMFKSRNICGGAQDIHAIDLRDSEDTRYPRAGIVPKPGISFIDVSRTFVGALKYFHLSYQPQRSFFQGISLSSIAEPLSLRSAIWGNLIDHLLVLKRQ